MTPTVDTNQTDTTKEFLKRCNLFAQTRVTHLAEIWMFELKPRPHTLMILYLLNITFVFPRILRRFTYIYNCIDIFTLYILKKHKNHPLKLDSRSS